MSEGIPIIFLFRGNRNFLPYTLYQAAKTNPNSRVILLGDRSNRHLSSIAEHYDCSDFENYAGKLSKVYRHKSQWGEDFEYVCIERWFLLYEFMRRQGLKKSVLLDSDILVYSDLTEVERTFPPYKMTWTGFSAHINFICDIEALKDYCDLVVRIFGEHEKSILDEQLLYAQVVTGRAEGNISDMTFFHDYNNLFPNRFFNVCEPYQNGIFDKTIEVDQGMEMENGFKKIVWKNKIFPHGILKDSGVELKLHTIHFWTKNAIPEYFTHNDLFFRLMNSYFKAVLIAQKIGRRIRLIQQ